MMGESDSVTSGDAKQRSMESYVFTALTLVSTGPQEHEYYFAQIK